MVASRRKDPQCAIPIVQAPKRANRTKMALHFTVSLRKSLYVNFEALYYIESAILIVYYRFEHLACILQMACFYSPSTCTTQACIIYPEPGSP